MSGHSKWANIQHRKLDQDGRKSKKFSKIINEIISLVKNYGTNNYRFKNLIAIAKSINIPKNTIEKAIKNSLKKNKNDYKNINLEGKIYGISIIMECKTDNNVRTISDIKNIYNKNGGTLCNNKELIHLFYRIVIFYIKKNNLPKKYKSIDDFELMLIDFGAKDILNKKKEIHVFSKFEDFGKMKNKLENLKINYQIEFRRIPKEKKNISEEKKKKVINLIEKIKNNNDIENIYSNLLF